MELTRRGLLASAAGAAALPIGQASAARPQILRVGMTAADLPTTHGIPNNGGEGFRFLGNPAYDSVINWDFTHTDKLADVTPGLGGGQGKPSALDLLCTAGRQIP